MTEAERRLLLALGRWLTVDTGGDLLEIRDAARRAIAEVEKERGEAKDVRPITGPNGWDIENVGVNGQGELVKLDPAKPAHLRGKPPWSPMWPDIAAQSSCKHHVPAGVACLECRLEKAERERDDAVSEADRRTREVELSCGVQMRLQRALDHARQALMGIADLAQWHDCQGVVTIARNAIRETDLTDRPVK